MPDRLQQRKENRVSLQSVFLRLHLPMNEIELTETVNWITNKMNINFDGV